MGTEDSSIALEHAVEIGATLREYGREEHGDAISTHITAWEDGDIQIEVYHTWVELVGGEHIHTTDYEETAVKKRWFESWTCNPDGRCNHSISYHNGDGPIYSKNGTRRRAKKSR